MQSVEGGTLWYKRSFFRVHPNFDSPVWLLEPNGSQARRAHRPRGSLRSPFSYLKTIDAQNYLSLSQFICWCNFHWSASGTSKRWDFYFGRRPAPEPRQNGGESLGGWVVLFVGGWVGQKATAEARTRARASPRAACLAYLRKSEGKLRLALSAQLSQKTRRPSGGRALGKRSVASRRPQTRWSGGTEGL